MAPKSKLKGPKHEIFEHGVFAQIRPVREGDLGTRPKNSKFLWLGPYILFLSATLGLNKNPETEYLMLWSQIKTPKSHKTHLTVHGGGGGGEGVGEKF
jgi:hypothetical protein